jgi:hypothetical protein
MSHAACRILALGLPLVLLAACRSDWDAPHWDAEVAACDRAVSSFFAARDMVELERSKFVIRRLECGIGPRLPPVSVAASDVGPREPTGGGPTILAGTGPRRTPAARGVRPATLRAGGAGRAPAGVTAGSTARLPG